MEFDMEAENCRITQAHRYQGACFDLTIRRL